MHPTEPYPDPHPDCRAPHLNPHEYSGPTHTCAGQDCGGAEHHKTESAGGNATRNTCALCVAYWAAQKGNPDLKWHSYKDSHGNIHTHVS